VLLATENAPPGKRSWYAMFPQLGAPDRLHPLVRLLHPAAETTSQDAIS
jgi:hypothetical protein